MQTLDLNLNKRYSYADYLQWFDDKRRELYEGFIKMMSPAPLRIHQEVLSNIFTYVSNYLLKKRCKVFVAPFDVRFPKNGETENSEIFTVLQPDLCIVCDLEKLDKRGCLGAPDFIIEITSPSTTKRDLNDKFKIYEQAGVKEYWIVRPEEQTVTIFLNENKKFNYEGIYTNDQTVSVNIFNNELKIDLKEVFDFE